MASPQLSALLAERLAGYRSAFELSCAGLFGSGASVTMEYEDEEDDGVSRAPAIDASSPVQTLKEPPTPGSADEFDEAPTVASMPDAATVKLEIEAALRFIATDFAQTFNQRLAELAQIDPVAEAVAPRYEFGPQHIADVGTALFDAVSVLLNKLASRDLDGARRASIDAWQPLERRIREKWQSYFVFTFQDLSVELKAERDRKRIKSSRVDKAAIEALATSNAARDALSDFAAPRTWERPQARSVLSPWLAVVVLLALAAAGGWLLAHSFGRRASAPVTVPH
jgi:hypothetical protein